jgi:hypothetical protein
MAILQSESQGVDFIHLFLLGDIAVVDFDCETPTKP